jgi:hypothetical protein
MKSYPLVKEAARHGGRCPNASGSAFEQVYSFAIQIDEASDD